MTFTDRRYCVEQQTTLWCKNVNYNIQQLAIHVLKAVLFTQEWYFVSFIKDKSVGGTSRISIYKSCLKFTFHCLVCHVNLWVSKSLVRYR